MSDDKKRVYPKGVFVFSPNEKAPDFVLGSVVINTEDLASWLKSDGAQYLTDYKGSPQLKLQILRDRSGKLNAQVDTWRPASAMAAAPAQGEKKSDDLPF